MKIETYRCDICGTPKKESNHWWKVFTSGRGALAIIPWEEAVSSMSGFTKELHICGETCAIRALTMVMHTAPKSAGEIFDSESKKMAQAPHTHSWIPVPDSTDDYFCTVCGVTRERSSIP